MSKKISNIDENDAFTEMGNIINEILLTHKEKWNGDDEIQDMLAESFVAGAKWHQDLVYKEYPHLAAPKRKIG